MKRIIYLFLSLALLSVTAHAQSKDEKDVAAAVRNLRKAMIDADKNQLDQITLPELSYGHSNGKVEDKATFIKVLVSGENDFVTMDISNQTIKLVGNTAIVRHKFFAKTNNGGKPATTKLGVLLIWQKQQGKWKLLARQACKLT